MKFKTGDQIVLKNNLFIGGFVIDYDKENNKLVNVNFSNKYIYKQKEDDLISQFKVNIIKEFANKKRFF